MTEEEKKVMNLVCKMKDDIGITRNLTLVEYQNLIVSLYNIIVVHKNKLEKQQKEIERLKKSISNERKLAEAQITYDMDETWKSKIQDKIDELEKEYQNVKEKYDLSQYISMSGYEILQKNQGYIKVLQKLLEEE